MIVIPAPSLVLLIFVFQCTFQAIIVLLLIGLVLTIPVAVLVFLYNLKSGFRAVQIDDDEEGNFIIF